MLPAIVKVLRTLKATEDATSEPATQSIYLLCDAALAVAHAVVDAHAPGTAATVGKFPGSVPLPKTFFRQLDRRQLTSKEQSTSGMCRRMSFSSRTACLPAYHAIMH